MKKETLMIPSTWYIKRVPVETDREPKKWMIYGKSYDTESEALTDVKNFEAKEKGRKFIVMKSDWVLIKEKVYETPEK